MPAIVCCKFDGWIRKIGKKSIWLTKVPGGPVVMVLPRNKVLYIEYADGTSGDEFFLRKISELTVPREVAISHGLEVIL